MTISGPIGHRVSKAVFVFVFLELVAACGSGDGAATGAGPDGGYSGSSQSEDNPRLDGGGPNLNPDGGGAKAPALPSFDARHAGTWQGKTSQNRPIEFAVREDGTLAGMRIEMRMTLAGGTCTGPMTADSTRLSGDSFDVPVTFVGGGVDTVVHGSFSGDTASGTYDGHSGGFALACGGTFSLGTGSLFGDGTWTATRCAGCSSTCEFAADGYCDEPIAGGSGLCFLDTDPVDCCSSPRDGVCDETIGGGVCNDRRDAMDCGYCPFTFDGECDEPDICPAGTDEVDCSQGGAACPFVANGECDEPEGTNLFPEGTDSADCVAPVPSVPCGSTTCEPLFPAELGTLAGLPVPCCLDPVVGVCGASTGATCAPLPEPAADCPVIAPTLPGFPITNCCTPEGRCGASLGGLPCTDLETLEMTGGNILMLPPPAACVPDPS